jgi:adenylylsulfate kinase
VTPAAATGWVIWLTGLPAAGKSTLATRLAQRLQALGVASSVLDSDAVRAALGAPAGQGPSERDAFYAHLAGLAALLAGQGLVVIVAATAPGRAHRAGARARWPRFLEVLVDAPLELCERRDPKGLYQAARAGALPELPGVGIPYEPPLTPDVVAAGGEDAAAVEAIVARVAPRPHLPGA